MVKMLVIKMVLTKVMKKVMIEVVKNHMVIILKGKKMDLNLIKREIKENLDFHDTVDILKESINKIKTLSGNDVDFKRLLGEIVSLSLPKLEGDEIKETELKQMDLIYRC